MTDDVKQKSKRKDSEKNEILILNLIFWTYFAYNHQITLSANEYCTDQSTSITQKTQCLICKSYQSIHRNYQTTKINLDMLYPLLKKNRRNLSEKWSVCDFLTIMVSVEFKKQYF